MSNNIMSKSLDDLVKMATMNIQKKEEQAAIARDIAIARKAAQESSQKVEKVDVNGFYAALSEGETAPIRIADGISNIDIEIITI